MEALGPPDRAHAADQTVEASSSDGKAMRSRTVKETLGKKKKKGEITGLDCYSAGRKRKKKGGEIAGDLTKKTEEERMGRGGMCAAAEKRLHQASSTTTYGGRRRWPIRRALTRQAVFLAPLRVEQKHGNTETERGLSNEKGKSPCARKGRHRKMAQ